jgi:hypothetical protein
MVEYLMVTILFDIPHILYVNQRWQRCHPKNDETNVGWGVTMSE